MARVRRSTLEMGVWQLFTGMDSAGYQVVGLCANPGCENPGARVVVCGRTPDARICVTCFEFEFGCTHPTAARLARD